MATQLDGRKPLWNAHHKYITWLSRHEDEIYERYLKGDENAGLIVNIVAEEDVARDAKAMAALMGVIERYIAEHHPEIAVIVK